MDTMLYQYLAHFLEAWSQQPGQDSQLLVPQPMSESPADHSLERMDGAELATSIEPTREDDAIAAELLRIGKGQPVIEVGKGADVPLSVNVAGTASNMIGEKTPLANQQRDSSDSSCDLNEGAMEKWTVQNRKKGSRRQKLEVNQAEIDHPQPIKIITALPAPDQPQHVYTRMTRGKAKAVQEEGFHHEVGNTPRNSESWKMKISHQCKGERN